MDEDRPPFIRDGEIKPTFRKNYILLSYIHSAARAEKTQHKGQTEMAFHPSSDPRNSRKGGGGYVREREDRYSGPG